MAGDWIKMRSNLWDDPRLAKLCDITDQPEAMIVGGLYWLWSTADQHSEDGLMRGLTTRSVDRKTGIKGFADALISIGWIEDSDDGIIIARFDEHNGASAKKRILTAKRVAAFKAGNAHETQGDDEGNAPSVTEALPVRDLDVDVDVDVEVNPSLSSPLPPVNGTRKGRVCGMLRLAGMSDSAPHYLPDDVWQKILEKRTDEEIVEVARAKMATRPNERIGLKYIAKALLDDPQPIEANARASPTGRRRTVAEEREAVSIALTGRKPNHERPIASTERDITGESTRVA